MKKLKKFISVLMAVAIVGATGMSVNAAVIDNGVSEEADLLYTNAYSASSSISISSSKATCRSIVSGKSSVTKIYISQILQKKSGSTWYDYAIWNKTEYVTSLTVQNTSNTLSSGTYRTKTIAKVYVGTSYETITTYSSSASF